MKKHIWLVVLTAVFMFISGSARAEDDKFEITSFDVRGNTLLPKEEVNKAVTPFTGKERVYGDVQRALEALEKAYRSKGFGTVTVFVPEQELKGGVVVLQVTEAVIGKITITGNKFFSRENVLAGLPLLKSGVAPNLGAISDNVQLSNENPAKHIDLTLGVSEEEGKVDARVTVADDKPRRVYVTLDNTGDDKKTGQTRLGISYRDANFLGQDKVLTLGYITSYDAPSGVDVDVYTVGLRVPLYSVGDSLDFILAASSVNIPANVVTPGGTLSLNGKGTIFASRWNHLFGRDGEYSSRMVYGADLKMTDNPCKIIISAGCVEYVETPLSVTYIGQWQKSNVAADFNIGAAYNITPFGHQNTWRYNYASNARSTDANFFILKSGGNYLQSFAGDWQVRGGVNGQFSLNPLPTSEQLGLVGSGAVRGFGERVLTADSGYVANLEGYTPDLAPIISPWIKHEFPGTLRALVFVDWAYGISSPKDGTAWFDSHGNITIPASLKAINEITTVSSIGIGMRYSLRKDIGAKFDVARVLDRSPASRSLPNIVTDDQWRVHFALIYGF